MNPDQYSLRSLYNPDYWLNDELLPLGLEVIFLSALPTDDTPESVHEYYELLFCSRSSKIPYQVNDTVYELEDGDFLLIPSGSHHRALPTTEPDPVFDRYVLRFTVPFLQNCLHIQNQNQFYAYMRPRILHAGSDHNFVQAKETFHICIREMEQREPNWQQIVKVASTFILCMVDRYVTTLESLPDDHASRYALLLPLLDYVEQNLGEKITLDDTAAHFSISRSTLNQYFRKYTGISFYTYVIQRRLVAAEALILQGVHMEQAGKQVGFPDYSAFYRAFKQRFGVSPQEWKARKT